MTVMIVMEKKKTMMTMMAMVHVVTFFAWEIMAS